MRLVLGSSSPRRARILSDLGLDFDVLAPDSDETRLPGEGPDVMVERLARHKAIAVAGPGRVVLAADTVVVHDGRILGKPVHPDEAASMLRRLQGDRHEVFTGVAVASPGGEVHSLVDKASVTFMAMTEEEIDDYVAGGEPMGKAGAYALQGEGGRFVQSVDGNPFTVIGLPSHLIARLLARVGHDFDEFRAPHVPESMPSQAGRQPLGHG